MIAIQIIRIHYREGQRGRVDAEKRARLRAFPLDVRDVVHACEVGFDYAVRMTTRGLPDAITDVAKLSVDGERLVVEPGFSLIEGQWGRLVANAKGGGFDDKWLIEIVVNAGVFAMPPSAQVFFGKPTFEKDVRRDFLRNAYKPSR